MGPIYDCLEGVNRLCGEIDLSPLLDDSLRRVECQTVHFIIIKWGKFVVLKGREEGKRGNRGKLKSLW